MQDITKVDVYAGDRLIGTIAEYDRGRTAFEYSAQWLATGFSISPFSLPLKQQLFVAEDRSMEGLFGVFYDSLPDGWGRLLTDRYLSSLGIERITPLTRLCMLSKTSSGLLEYKPSIADDEILEGDDLDELHRITGEILEDSAVSQEDLERLYAKGGSSGGARPKVNIDIDGEPWIVKFPTRLDGPDAGYMEYECNKKATDAGLTIPDIRLLPSRYTKGFFAVRRFDRHGGRRIHMLSLSGLLESSHRYPALDYTHLLKATLILTRSEEALYEAFRMACFNVMIGNQDDHGKNFAFLYDETLNGWQLAPAYDLTKSSTSFGEQSTTVCGKGRDINDDDLRRLGDMFSLDEQRRNEIIRDVHAAVG